MAGGSWWREEDGRDRGGAFSARTQEPELFLGTQVQEGMRDTSAAQITSGVCEGGSLLISERWGKICWRAEAAAAHSYIITCSSQAGSPVGTAQPIQQHVPGIQAKSSTFFSQNQDTDGLFKWPAILLIHTFIREDLSYEWWQILSLTEGLTCHTNKTFFICGLLSQDRGVSRSHEVKPLFSSFLSAAELLTLWNTQSIWEQVLQIQHVGAVNPTGIILGNGGGRKAAYRYRN